MASDLKIEIFANNLFLPLWYELHDVKSKCKILEIYGDECNKVNDYREACDDLFVTVFSFRHAVFRKIYMAEFTVNKAKSFKSPLDFYEYVVQTCDRNDLFTNLTVFQRMFATVTFVAAVCLRMHLTTHVIDVVKYGHIFWAMYFDKFTDEFYEKGGFDELRKAAKPYEYLSEFAHFFYENASFNLKATKEACVNYQRLKNAVYQEQNSEHAFHISKLWIKFSIKHFESYIKIPPSYEIYLNTSEAELLLEDLKLIFTPSRRNSDDEDISEEKRQDITFSSMISYSKFHCNSEEIKPKDDDDIQTLRLSTEHQRRSGNKEPNKYSNICSKCEKETGNECPTSEMEVRIREITDKNGCLEIDKNTLTEVELLRQISSADSTKNSHIKRNIPPTINEQTLSKTNTKKSPDRADLDLGHSSRSMSFVNKGDDSTIENFTAQIISKNQKEEIEWHRKTIIKNQANTRDLSFENESVDNDKEMENLEKKMDMRFYLRNDDDKKIIKTVDVSSTSHVTASELDEKTALKSLPGLKDFHSEKEIISCDDESKIIRKLKENLRKEQRDPDMKNFLKMHLVLGDLGGIKFVLSTLDRREESHAYPKKVQINKKKKDLKRKSLKSDFH